MSANQYYDQVIYIESMRYRAHWPDAHHSSECHFIEAPQSDVINEVWSKWFLRKGPNNSIVLESLRYRNHFLDAHHSKTCHVTESSYPYDDDWALWYLEDEGDGNVSFRSKRYPDSRLDAHHGGPAKVTNGSGEWSLFKIYQPTYEDQKVLLFSYNNTKGSTPVHTEYTEKVGITKTWSSTSLYTVSAEIGAEIVSIFSAKSSSSASWTSSSSQTWGAEVTRTVAVEVTPGYKKEIF